jgi:PhnB protein
MHMQQFIPYLGFGGNCREAIEFYAKTLGGQIIAMMSYADMPGCEQMPGGSAQKIMHAALVLPDGSALYAGDAPEHEPFEGQKGVMITMTYPTVQEGKRIFDTLGKGCKITMPWEATFWAKGFGMVTDSFGTSWAVNGEKIPPPQTH